MDFKQIAKYCNAGIYFVTRLKRNADYKVVQRNDVSGYKYISSDQIIEMTGYFTSKKCPLKLRRIRSKDPETGKYIVILTNQLEWAPTTIAAIYKDRWQIEIFIKTIKQNLKIKKFFGTSRNAVMTQIWIALITHLMLQYLKMLSSKSWTHFSLMKLLPSILTTRKDLWCILNKLPPPGKNTPGLNYQLELLWLFWTAISICFKKHYRSMFICNTKTWKYFSLMNPESVLSSMEESYQKLLDIW